MNSDFELKFFSAPGKIRLKPLTKLNTNKREKNKLVNNYIILQLIKNLRQLKYLKSFYHKK